MLSPVEFKYAVSFAVSCWHSGKELNEGLIWDVPNYKPTSLKTHITFIIHLVYFLSTVTSIYGLMHILVYLHAL